MDRMGQVGIDAPRPSLHCSRSPRHEEGTRRSGNVVHLDGAASLREPRAALEPEVRNPSSEGPSNPWGLDDDMVLGIDILDEQHGRIARLLDSLASTPPSRRNAAWERLLSALSDHFALEDRMMAGAYTPRSVHRRDHDRFLSSLSRAASANEASTEILDTAQKWLSSHLKGMDADLAFFLREPELWLLRLESQLDRLADPEITTPHHPQSPRPIGRDEELP